jgi:hypothetical protein
VNEKNKAKNNILLIVGIVLLAWSIGGTSIGIIFYNKYNALQSIIDKAGGDEFVELVEKHGNTIVSVYNNTVAVREELESANGYVAELEQRIERAYDIAEQSDDEFIKFGNTMASHGTTLQDSIQLQRRTIEFVGRIEANNSAIKAELGNSF